MRTRTPLGFDTMAGFNVGLVIFYFKNFVPCGKIVGMKNVIKFLCNFALCFVAIDAFAREIAPDEVVGDIDINSGTEESELTIINYGIIDGDISIASGIGVTIQNYGVINGAVNCSTCALVNQVITGNGDINPIAGLSGHSVVVVNNATEISLADVIAVAGNAGQIVLTGLNVVVDVNAIGEHPNMCFNSNIVLLPWESPESVNTVNSASIIVYGVTENWDVSQPFLTGIEDFANFAGATFEGVDSMFDPVARPYGDSLYVVLKRQTNYKKVFENDLGDWLDELRDENPDDKLIGALDAARSRAGLRDVLSNSMRTNPIRLLDPVRSFNTFIFGDHIHDLAFGVVAEPFYIYSGDFSVLGGGAGVAGRITKNLVAKFGGYAGRMNYDGELDDFNAMVYGANFGALYKDSDFYARAVGTLSSAQFKDIEIFDGVRGKQNPNGISGAGVADGGIVFRVLDEFDLTPFIGARFDYVGVAGFSDTDVNMRFGVNIDKETIVDGNKYAFGLSAVGQTNGDIYGSIYTDIMSVVDGVGGRLQFGILNDDLGLSYRISLDAKFAF